MARKNRDIGELARSLKAPAFENKDSEQRAGAIDPVSPTGLVLSLTEIKPYEHNPRRAENPEFYRLKDSIASQRRLTTPLTVTKRPGDARFTIAAGGNTRLQVLNELFEETQDEVFNRVACQFAPWESDCQVLANHLIENDVRGNMMFADKARAIVAWQHLYEAVNSECSSLSQRALKEKLRDSGFQVSQALLSRYLYTAEYLMPVLPKTLESGLGRPLIEQLIRFRTFAQQHWDEVPLAEGFTPALKFEDVFAAVCSGEDRHCDDWDFDIFRSALATRVAEVLDLDPKIVAIDLDSLYHGIPVRQLGSEAPAQHRRQPQWAFERAREHLAAQVERARQRQQGRGANEAKQANQANQANLANQAKVSDLEHDGRAIADELDAGPDLRAGHDLAGQPQLTIRTSSDLDAPREVIYKLARRLAESNGLGDLLKPCEAGLGFYIDAPEPPEFASVESHDQVAADTSEDKDVAFSTIQSWIWWWLCLCAEQLDHTHLREIGTRDPSSWLFQLFEQLPQRVPGKEPLHALYLLVGQPDWLKFVPDLLGNAALPDESFTELITLICHCRTLGLSSDAASISLWELAK